jgi:hypothetical protein
MAMADGIGNWKLVPKRIKRKEVNDEGKGERLEYTLGWACAHESSWMLQGWNKIFVIGVGELDTHSIATGRTGREQSMGVSIDIYGFGGRREGGLRISFCSIV